MSLYKPKGSPFFHYDFQWKGRRFYGSTGEKNLRRAQAVEDAAKIAAKTGSGKRQASLDEVAESYWQAAGQHARAAKADEKRLLWLVTTLGPDAGMHEIEEPQLLDALARRRGLGSKRSRKAPAPVSNATLNRCVTELFRRLHVHARKRMKVEVAEIDWSVLRLAEAEERTRELSAEEERRLFANLREDMHAVLRFSLATGIRKQDAIGLTRFQLDLQAGKVRLKVKSHLPGRKTHTVMLAPSMVALLANELASHDLEQAFTYAPHDTHGRLIEGAPRKPMTVSVLRCQFERAVERAGIRDFRWHDVRHTTGSRFNRVAGLRATQTLLGHADVKTTTKYAHTSEEDMRRHMMAMERLGEEGAQRPLEAGESRNTPEQSSGGFAKKRT